MNFKPLNNRGFLQDPGPLLREMRESCPVYRYEESALPLVNVFRYEDVKAVLQDHQLYSNTLAGEQQDMAFTDPYNLLGMDPPQHRRMRDVVKKVFTPAMVNALEPLVADNCTRIMNEVLELGEFDGVEDFAAPLAVHMICQLTGVPQEDQALIRDWTRRATELGFDLLWEKHSNTEREQDIAVLMQTMHDYFAEKIDERLKHPANDILSQLAHSGLSKQECVSFTRLLLVAGNETTGNLINNMLGLLIDHPQQEQILRENPGLVNNTIEEVLRYWPSIRATFRQALADSELQGVKINKGEIVWLWLMSANRDTQLCERAEEFDISRDATRHFALGHGIHTCLGNALARLESRVMLNTLLDRTRSMSRSREELEPLNSIISNGVHHQFLRFQAK